LTCCISFPKIGNFGTFESGNYRTVSSAHPEPSLWLNYNIFIIEIARVGNGYILLLAVTLYGSNHHHCFFWDFQR